MKSKLIRTHATEWVVFLEVEETVSAVTATT